jgi:hypothetical protein
MRKHPNDPNGRVCLWCGGRFDPRRDGGKPRVFCRPDCRRIFDAAARRWVAEAIATGLLTLDALKNGPTATRALVPTAVSSPHADEAARQSPAPVAPRADSRYAHQQDLERLMAKAIAMRRR